MKQIIRLAIPEKAEIIFTLSLSVLLLGILNFKRFWLMLDGNTAMSAADQNSLDNNLLNILNNIEKHISPNWLDVAMWLLIGCLGFLIFSTITAAIKSTEEEVELVHYFNNPKGRRHEINAFLTKAVVRLAALVVGLIWVITFLDIIMPFCVKLFFTSVTSIRDYSSWLWLVMSIVIFAASLYVFAVISRLVALKSRIL